MRRSNGTARLDLRRSPPERRKGFAVSSSKTSADARDFLDDEPSDSSSNSERERRRRINTNSPPRPDAPSTEKSPGSDVKNDVEPEPESSPAASCAGAAAAGTPGLAAVGSAGLGMCT